VTDDENVVTDDANVVRLTQGATQAFHLALNMYRGILNLSIDDKSSAERSFKSAQRIILKLSDSVIDADLARKWFKNLQQIIELAIIDSRKAKIMANNLLVEMERKFL
jgi:hypothetical protein